MSLTSRQVGEAVAGVRLQGGMAQLEAARVPGAAGASGEDEQGQAADGGAAAQSGSFPVADWVVPCSR